LFNVFAELNTASDIEIGDKMVVSADLTLSNGTVLKITNDDGTANYGQDIANSTEYSVIQEFVVSCPLDDASNFNGNYKVTQDDWADYAVNDIVPVVYNPADGLYTFRILNTANPFVVNSSTSYIIVTIDPSTSNVSVTSNEMWNYGGGFIVTVTGDGNVGSCTGDINLKLDFSGSSQNQTLSLVKA
jgi:hypothetical protein